MRKTVLAEGEYYHIFNRGVERRDIFMDADDIERFLESLNEFNRDKPIGSIYESRISKRRKFGSSTPKIVAGDALSGDPIVEMVCYCLNPNHFHIVLKQLHDRGIQRFMQRLGTGYTNYFNEKYRRAGALFQGRYKSVHIHSNEQLLHASVYVNLNNRFGSSTPKLSASSWGEYVSLAGNTGDTQGMCSKDVILAQFKSPEEYKVFAEDVLPDIIERKRAEKELADLHEDYLGVELASVH